VIHKNLAKDILAIEADQGQIIQVLLNLFINAADAMPTGGKLTVETSNIPHSRTKSRPFRAKPGHYVLLKVADSGSGMTKETLNRLFEPFFTTKTMGRGTGLGLASVFGIVKAHGGYIDVESQINKGATFNVYLPATDKNPKEDIPEVKSASGGKETILLIDDEEMVLETSAMMLEKLGYTVFPTDSGKTALDIYKQEKDTIDMVILDMIMPDVSGNETYDALKKADSDVKVLLSSGYSIDGQANEILKRGCNGFIQKPFTMDGLSIKIQEVLKNTA